ncbi:bifunctional tryptophan synthase trp1, partial [Lunasporangiospora selenospora]
LIDLGVAPKQLDFVARIRQNLPLPAVMGEIKRASPSKGNIDLDANAAEQSLAYARAGASVISVLTEPKWFKGSLNDMRVVRAMIDSLPNRPAVLRKDFIVDPYQILEARVYGADTILLIVAMLSVEQLHSLYKFAKGLGIEPLVEVNNAQEMEVAIELGAKVIGVNNRNLHNFEVDMQTTTNLANMVPADTILVALSGIKGREDVEHYMEQGVKGVLVGEALMLSKDKRTFIRDLLGLPTEVQESKVLVKICGVQTVDAALQAADAGADFLGMIFVEGSKRHVKMDVAAEIVEAVREYANATAAAFDGDDENFSQKKDSDEVANSDWFSMHARRAERNPRKPMIVGVFRDASLEEITRVVDTLKIDLVQFHGGENPEQAKFLPVPVIKAFHCRGDENPKEVIQRVAGTRGLNAYCLLDAAGKAGGYGGGEGNSFEWSLAKAVVESQEGGFPILLAGGLTPENVSEAVRAVRPWAVDVSSGVETEGEKDGQKIRDFVEPKREDIIASAVKFLQDPKVQTSTLGKKVAFLESKGLTSEEIEDAMQRANGTAPAAAAPLAMVPAGQPQYAQQGMMVPGGQMMMAPPALPPKRNYDWKDIFIAAVVAGGFGYGVFQVAKKVIGPKLQYPSQEDLDLDKKKLDEQFEEIEKSLTEVKDSTTTVAKNVEEQTAHVKDSLESMSGVLDGMKTNDDKREQELAGLKSDIENIKTMIPQLMDKNKESQTNVLNELQSEIKSLKSLLLNRRGPGAASPVPAPTGMASPTAPWSALNYGATQPAAAASTSAPAAASKPAEENGASSFLSGKASIPAWQLTAQKNVIPGTTPGGASSSGDSSATAEGSNATAP